MERFFFPSNFGGNEPGSFKIPEKVPAVEVFSQFLSSHLSFHLWFLYHLSSCWSNKCLNNCGRAEKTWKSSLRGDTVQHLSSKADIGFLIPNLGICHSWQIGFLSPASRHRHQIKNTPAELQTKHFHSCRQRLSLTVWLVWGRVPCLRLACLGKDLANKKKRADFQRGRGWDRDGGLFVAAPKRVCSRCKHNLLTEPGWWCSACGGPNQVSPPVRCGSAFCRDKII